MSNHRSLSKAKYDINGMIHSVTAAYIVMAYALSRFVNNGKGFFTTITDTNNGLLALLKCACW